MRDRGRVAAVLVAGPWLTVGMAALLAAGLAARPAAAQIEVAPSWSAHLEYDSNARRQAFDPEAEVEDEEPNKAPVGDALVRARAGVRVVARALGGQLAVDANLGLKRFFTAQSQSMAVGQVWASLARPLPFGLVLSVSELAKIRGQASGARTYGYSRTDVDVGRALLWGLYLRAGVYSTGFFSFDAPLFSSVEAGPRVELSLGVTPKERIDVDVMASVRGYRLSAADEFGETTLFPRVDAPITLSAGLTSMRRLYLALRYSVTRNPSTSFGDSYTRHRVTATAGVRLPLEITVTGQGALQITSYDNGLSIGQRLFLADDDESQNSLQVSVGRPFLWGITTEARLAWYGNEFARERVSFARTTASLGLRLDL